MLAFQAAHECSLSDLLGNPTYLHRSPYAEFEAFAFQDADDYSLEEFEGIAATFEEQWFGADRDKVRPPCAHCCASLCTCCCCIVAVVAGAVRPQPILEYPAQLRRQDKGRQVCLQLISVLHCHVTILLCSLPTNCCS